MQIQITAVGERMPTWVEDGFKEYTQRMPAECHVKLIEIAAKKRLKNPPLKKIQEEEGNALLASVPKNHHIVSLERTGKEINTQQLAKYLEKCLLENQSFSLLIGGPEGLAPECLEASQQIWSLSKLTFPHMLVRIMIAEQLYRAWSILKHHPYHR